MHKVFRSRSPAWLLLAGVLGHGGSAALGAQEPAGSRDVRALDRAHLDTSCAPCTDFYHFANGGWLTRASIPAAYPAWGSWDEAIERTDSLVHLIVEEARRDTAAPPGGTTRKIGTFYSTCVDSVRAEAEGLAPLGALLGRIATIQTADGVARMITELQQQGLGVLFGFLDGQDPKNSAQVIAIASQGGLGLPERDDYTRTDSASRRLRHAYAEHVTKMLVLSGQSSSQARRHADRILTLETKLARASMSREDQRDPNTTYHRMTVAELQALTPHFAWERFLRALGVPNVTVINVMQPNFFAALDRLLVSTPVDTWKAYLRWQVLRLLASNLSSAFANEEFRYSRRFTGATERVPRWRQCLEVTGILLGEAVGQEYVKQHFVPEAKAQARGMVANLIAALRQRIEQLAWMSDDTKRQALAKLEAIRVKVGYPDTWRDYSTLEIKPGPYVDNFLRAIRWYRGQNLAKIGKPVDLSEWDTPPQTVDAFAGYTDIVFPAGILQPPFFDPEVDDAVNYGAIGTTIGHELTHLFDDQGRQFDAQGNLRDWWTPKDAARYRQRAQRVVEQFDAYTVVDSATHVNGKLTLGENISDLGGVQVAYQALQQALAAKGRPPLIGGFTPEQRFFIAYAQSSRQLARPEYLRARVTTDPHAPWMWRVNGPLANLLEFAKAFHCKPGDAMVRPDSLRAQIW